MWLLVFWLRRKDAKSPLVGHLSFLGPVIGVTVEAHGKTYDIMCAIDSMSQFTTFSLKDAIDLSVLDGNDIKVEGFDQRARVRDVPCSILGASFFKEANATVHFHHRVKRVIVEFN